MQGADQLYQGIDLRNFQNVDMLDKDAKLAATLQAQEMIK